MNSKQYEEYVADVVRTLSISKKAKLYRNRRYSGIRQPGSYEIDIACEVWVDDALFFLIIVECKNWKRPIDRPQIQKLIQTRDAINAHKAAFASPTGYTKEAIEVAKGNGVALWVIAKGTFVGIGAGGAAALSVARIMSDALRLYIYELLEYKGDYYENLRRRVNKNLIPVSWLKSSLVSTTKVEDYYALVPGVSSKDPIMAVLIAHTLDNLTSGNSITNKIADHISKYLSILIRSGMKAKIAHEFIDEIIELTMDTVDFPFGSWDKLEAFDSNIDHSNTKLLVPSDWLEENNQNCICISANAGLFPTAEVPVSYLQNNSVWANAIWLLCSDYP